MNKKTPSPRTNRSQLACPQCHEHRVGVRDTVVKGSQVIERYRFCEACQHAFKTREQVVSDYRESTKSISAKVFS